jgi:hypothetical protein
VARASGLVGGFLLDGLLENPPCIGRCTRKDEARVGAPVLTLGIRKANRGSLASALAEGEKELVALLRSRIERRLRPGWRRCVLEGEQRFARTLLSGSTT